MRSILYKHTRTLVNHITKQMSTATEKKPVYMTKGKNYITAWYNKNLCQQWNTKTGELNFEIIIAEDGTGLMRGPMCGKECVISGMGDFIEKTWHKK